MSRETGLCRTMGRQHAGMLAPRGRWRIRPFQALGYRHPPTMITPSTTRTSYTPTRSPGTPTTPPEVTS